MSNLIPCKFQFEDLEVFEGFYHPDNKYWNGWLNPYVDAETHRKVSAFLLQGMTEENKEDYTEALEYAEMEPEENGFYFWGMCWCWDEVTEGDTK